MTAIYGHCLKVNGKMANDPMNLALSVKLFKEHAMFRWEASTDTKIIVKYQHLLRKNWGFNNFKTNRPMLVFNDIPRK